MNIEYDSCDYESYPNIPKFTVFFTVLKQYLHLGRPKHKEVHKENEDRSDITSPPFAHLDKQPNEIALIVHLEIQLEIERKCHRTV